ncbi:asparaginase [Ramlibacter tataouinensis]|uniref:Asparagine amidohydrolase n=1 Tax=Ramlibacter tataouinensis TaxID=94132 RepID=A0A127JZC4_9BURK|nr:asparaginase [Ramlibacter tataouinensis]AMO25336.1 asparagine amidohydrolase [Ramlibacter tataouinensis]
MASLVPLFESHRGGTLESVNFGAVAVCDSQGRVLGAAGDPHWLTFTRSTLKPLQALPFLQSGGAQALGFTASNIALLCASHSGEPMHVEQVQQMLDKAGVGLRRLQCGCHVPYYVEQGVGAAPAAFDERHHNCSGKHTGFLAHCVHRGWPLDSYLEPAHPLQQEVRRDVARAVGLSEGELRMGIDGCSAPNYAMPLAHLARGYARLARGAADGEFGASFAALAGAMGEFPELGSGTGRNDLAFMRAGGGDWLSKAGADGVQVVASKSRGQAVAVKIADGGKLAAAAVTVAALDQLGWLDGHQREELRPWRAQEILSVRGAPVGERKTAFRLAPA